MKPFPEHDAEWVESLPFYGTISRDECGRLTRVTTWLFAGSRSSRREAIEEGFTSTLATPEERDHNEMMASRAAAFADIVAQYTRAMYGRARSVTIFKILAQAWRCRHLPNYGTREWMHRICQEVAGGTDL